MLAVIVKSLDSSVLISASPEYVPLVIFVVIVQVLAVHVALIVTLPVGLDIFILPVVLS